MLEEHLPLQSGGAVQLDVAVLLFQSGDALLELLFARGADREADLRVEHRGMPAGLQLSLILAREHPVLPGEQARAVRRALYLLVVGMLDVGDPLTYLRKRLTVPKPPRVYRGVDREPDGLQRSEQH